MHQTLDTLHDSISDIRKSPSEVGTLEMIVRRPEQGQREVLTTGTLDVEDGLVGDTWKQRPSSRTDDGGPHPDMQLNIMNARAIGAIAGSRDRWPLAGDQLFVDLDLSDENLPSGTRLTIGSATIEITDQPHTGCQKFSQRFGVDALRFVNSDAGRSVRARGINARVVVAGTVAAGDTVEKVSGPGGS